jgi:hypothetical protein
MVTIDGYIIDAFLTVDPQQRAEATSLPVETGAAITDHVIVRPPIIRVVGLVTDTPLGVTEQGEEDARAAQDALKPSTDAYLFLSDLLAKARLCTIVSNVFPPFKNCLLVSLVGPQDADTGDAYLFTAEFQVAILADINVEERDTLADAPRVKKKKDKGALPSVEVPDAAKAVERNQSIFDSLTESAADWWVS